MSDGGSNVVSVFGSLMFVAVVAVIVSNRANTSKIVQSIGTATGGVIGAAVAPLSAGSNSS
jgi:hypothetical protein